MKMTRCNAHKIHKSAGVERRMLSSDILSNVGKIGADYREAFKKPKKQRLKVKRVKK